MQMTMPLNQATQEEQIQMINTVKNAIEAMQSSRRAEAERAKQKEKRLNEMFARDLEARKARESIRPCFADRVWEKLVNAYAVAYAAVYLIAGKLVVVDEEN